MVMKMVMEMIDANDANRGNVDDNCDGDRNHGVHVLSPGSKVRQGADSM